MTSDRRSPWWPYLLVLAGLFVLSLAVPRGWQTGIDRRPHEVPRQTAEAKHKSAPVRPVVVLPDEEPLAVAARQFEPPAEQQHISVLVRSAVDSPSSFTPADNFAAVQPLAEMVSQRIADARRFIATRRSAARSQSPLDKTDAKQGADNTATLSLPSVKAHVSNHPEAPSDSPVATWPLPHSLVEQLDRLSQHLECRDWALFAKQLCETLAETSVDRPKDAMAVIGQLHSLSAQADAVASQLKDPRAAAEFRRVQYALQRRLLAWDLAATASNRATAYANVLTGEEQRRRLSDSTTAVQTYLDTVPYGDAWAKYLSLDEVARLASIGSSSSLDEVRITARRVLNLLSPHGATLAQRKILSDRTIQSLAEQLQPLANEPIDNRELLTEIERYETTRLPSDAVALVDLQQRLAWSATPMCAWR
jgi:hypothetical protein